MCRKYAVFLFIYFFQISFSKTHRLISICGKTCKIVAKSMAVVTYTCMCIPAYMHVCMATCRFESLFHDNIFLSCCECVELPNVTPKCDGTVTSEGLCQTLIVWHTEVRWFTCSHKSESFGSQQLSRLSDSSIFDCLLNCKELSYQSCHHNVMSQTQMYQKHAHVNNILF